MPALAAPTGRDWRPRSARGEGERCAAGPTCPDGYSLQGPGWGPGALVCRRDGAPDPEPWEDDGGLVNLTLDALDPTRRTYP